MLVLQFAGDFFDLEAFDHIACLDVVVVLERHTAFKAALDLFDFILEALEGFQAAFMDNDAVTQQAHFGTPADLAFGDIATGDLGNVEHFADLRVAKEGFAQGRCQQTAEQTAYIVDQVIDDRVVANVHIIAAGHLTRLSIGPDVEADQHRTG